MTYDRAVLKLPADAAEWNKRMYSAPPLVRTLVAAADAGPQSWRYTTDSPQAEWIGATFDDQAWQQGPGGFGKTTSARAVTGTAWGSPDLWLRRTFELPARPLVNPHLRVFHDDDAEIFVNGVKVAGLTGANGGYAYLPLDDAAMAALHAGPNTLAVHVRNTRGDQYLDVGMVEVVEK
jgi:hypothetical protein